MTALYTFRGIALPEELRESIDAYVEDGRPPGDFLTACIENDLSGAFGRADERSLASLSAIVGYLYNECPISSWGRKGSVKAWMEEKRQAKAEGVL